MYTYTFKKWHIYDVHVLKVLGTCFYPSVHHRWTPQGRVDLFGNQWDRTLIRLIQFPNLSAASSVLSSKCSSFNFDGNDCLPPTFKQMKSLRNTFRVSIFNLNSCITKAT